MFHRFEATFVVSWLQHVGVDGRRVVAQRVADVAAYAALGHQVEEEQVLEALQRDGAQRRQPQQQRREATLLRAARPPAVLVQAREHLQYITHIIRQNTHIIKTLLTSLVRRLIDKGLLFD